MTEEAKEQTEESTEPEAEQKTEQKTEAQVDDKSEQTEQDEKNGKGFVDFKDPEIEARFKRVYGNMKQWERVAERLGEDNKALIERLDRLEKGQKDSDIGRQLSDLQSARKQAYEAGDFDKLSEIDDQIVDLKLAQKVQPDSQSNAQSNAQSNGQQKSDSPNQMSPEDQAKMKAWAEEQKDGEKLRPWADPGHPDHSRAMRVATAVIQDPELSYAPMEEILGEIDRIMGVSEKPKRKTASVLSSDPPRTDKKEIKLTEDEKLVARKMGMKPEDYAKARQKWQAA